MKKGMVLFFRFFESLGAVCAFLVLTLAVVGLTGCSPAAQDADGSATPANGFQSVLEGDAPFFSTDLNQSLTIHELNLVVSDDDSVTAEIRKFAVVDLDGDGTSEVVLWLRVNGNDDFGFAVLRRQEEQIYGYTLVYRAFMELKQDGTFFFSSGAADSGFGFLTFTDSSYTIDKITYSQSSYDDNQTLSVSYFVDGQAASEDAYLSAIQEQDKKESVLWHDFTRENIASYLT